MVDSYIVYQTVILDHFGLILVPLRSAKHGLVGLVGGVQNCITEFAWCTKYKHTYQYIMSKIKPQNLTLLRVCVCVNFPLNKRIYFSIKNQKGQHDLSSKSLGKKGEERDGKRPKCITRKGSKDHTIMHDHGGSQIGLFLGKLQSWSLSFTSYFNLVPNL